MRVGRDAVPVCVARYVDARPRTAGGRRINPPGWDPGVVRPPWTRKRSDAAWRAEVSAGVSAQGCARPLARGRPV